MPLFIYECRNCKKLKEKFLHSFNDKIELICECGCEEFERILSYCKNKITKSAQEMYKEEIEPEVDRIITEMNKEKGSTWDDICGKGKVK